MWDSGVQMRVGGAAWRLEGIRDARRRVRAPMD